MALSTPRRSCSAGRSLLFFCAAMMVLAPPATQAQQAANHTGATVAHPRPIIVTPPARPAAPVATPRVATPGYPAIAGRFTSTPRVMRGGQLATVRVIVPRNSAPSFFRTPLFFRPFYFGAPFIGSLGVAGSISQPGGMPLGFGLWPACDSAGTPGVFWTVGPCFGIGDYSAESAAGVASAYSRGAAPLSADLFPLIVPEQEPSGAAAENTPNATTPAPAMVLYFTNGQSIAATDWWVTLGRLQYVTESGTTSSVDVSQLDIEQTIKKNQTRGLEFHLRFTPPSER
jgi:hypothetical protein